jgi:hypothetical protein
MGFSKYTDNAIADIQNPVIGAEQTKALSNDHRAGFAAT